MNRRRTVLAVIVGALVAPVVAAATPADAATQTVRSQIAVYHVHKSRTGHGHHRTSHLRWSFEPQVTFVTAHGHAEWEPLGTAHGVVQLKSHGHWRTYAKWRTTNASYDVTFVMRRTGRVRARVYLPAQRGAYGHHVAAAYSRVMSVG